MATEKSLDALLDERLHLHQTNGSTNMADGVHGGGDVPSVALPPTMQKIQDTSVDDLLREMNKIPLFMTNLDDAEDNPELEALKALAYEGTRAEIAQNFREQGSELVRLEKRYPEAREFYTKALHALHSPRPELDPEDGPQVIELDEEAETKKEREIEEVCLVNRALCNLEMTDDYVPENYGSCNRDCAAALLLNPRNVKAWYRASLACLALDKITEALDACSSGLKYDQQNEALTKLMKRCTARKEFLENQERQRRQRELREKTEAATLRAALQKRNIITRTTPRPPEIPESAISLSDPQDPDSSLSFPVMLLYPAHAQTDFIKSFDEASSLVDHLEYILPLPWDEGGEYSIGSVEAYMETATGGLIKVGKKIVLSKILSSGSVEVVDRLVRINVLPKGKVDEWIEQFKARRGK